MTHAYGSMAKVIQVCAVHMSMWRFWLSEILAATNPMEGQPENDVRARCMWNRPFDKRAGFACCAVRAPLHGRAGSKCVVHAVVGCACTNEAMASELAGAMGALGEEGRARRKDGEMGRNTKGERGR